MSRRSVNPQARASEADALGFLAAVLTDWDNNLDPLSVQAALDQLGARATAGLKNIIEDLTPQLGGDLDVNGWSIISLSNGNILLVPNGTGKIILGNNAEVINGKGLVVGHTSKIDVGVLAELQVLGTGGADSSFLLGRWSNNAGGSRLRLFKSRAATIGSNGIVQDGDEVNAIRWQADDGVDYNTNVAELKVQMDGVPGANDMPGRMIFSVTAAGASSLTERMRLANGGNFGIGVTNPTEKLDVGGNVRISGHTILSNEKTIKTNTSDGADNESIGIAGGGSIGSIRGSFVRVSGNENGNTGKLFLTAGNVAGGEVKISTGGAARITVDENGLTGFGTATPQKDLHVSSAVPTIRLSDSNAGTDQAVATLIEFYRGNNTNRVGFWGMASASNDVMVLGTDYAAGELSLRTGSNVERLNISSAGDFDFKAGNLITAGNLTVGGTIVTPTILSFVNATHDHQSAAGGGTLDAAAIAAGTLADARIDVKYRTVGKVFFIGTATNPVTASERYPLGMFPKAFTITHVRYTCNGSSTPTVDFQLEKHNEATPFTTRNTVWSADKTATETSQTTETFDAADIGARETLWLLTGILGGIPKTLIVTVEGTID